MERIKKIIKILKNFVDKYGMEYIEIFYDNSEWFCFVEHNEIFITDRKHPEPDKLFYNYCFELGLRFKCSIEILSFLHEVGHLQTHDTLTEQELEITEYLEHYARLNDTEESLEEIDAYMRSPRERIATQWAVDFVNKNYEQIELLQERIEKVL